MKFNLIFSKSLRNQYILNNEIQASIISQETDIIYLRNCNLGIKARIKSHEFGLDNIDERVQLLEKKKNLDYHKYITL